MQYCFQVYQLLGDAVFSMQVSDIKTRVVTWIMAVVFLDSKGENLPPSTYNWRGMAFGGAGVALCCPCVGQHSGHNC